MSGIASMTMGVLPRIPPCFACLGASVAGLAQKPRESPAARLQRRLRPISYSLGDFREAHIRAVDVQQGIQQLAKRRRLSGRWKKDKQLSEPMDEACDLVQLPWVLRQGIKIIDTLEARYSV